VLENGEGGRDEPLCPGVEDGRGKANVEEGEGVHLREDGLEFLVAEDDVMELAAVKMYRFDVCTDESQLAERLSARREQSKTHP